MGEKLTVTARPFSSKEGQARIQFVTGKGTNDELNMRVDLDEISASLDLGSHEGKTHKLLNSVGVPHQTYVVFEKQFSDPETFARMVKTYAKIFDMNIW